MPCAPTARFFVRILRNMHAQGVRLIVLLILLLGHAIINVSGQLVQPMGDVKQPDPHIMRKMFCDQYCTKMLGNIQGVINNMTEVLEQTRDITKNVHSLSKGIFLDDWIAVYFEPWGGGGGGIVILLEMVTAMKIFLLVIWWGCRFEYSFYFFWLSPFILFYFCWWDFVVMLMVMVIVTIVARVRLARQSFILWFWCWWWWFSWW